MHEVDAVHAALEDVLAELLAGEVQGPADKDHGQRELIVRAPDGQLLVFGAQVATGGAD